jgi:hypothetical protein
LACGKIQFPCVASGCANDSWHSARRVAASELIDPAVQKRKSWDAALEQVAELSEPGRCRTSTACGAAATVKGRAIHCWALVSTQARIRRTPLADPQIGEVYLRAEARGAEACAGIGRHQASHSGYRWQSWLGGKTPDHACFHPPISVAVAARPRRRTTDKVPGEGSDGRTTLVVDCIVMFPNPKRLPAKDRMLAPVESERRLKPRYAGVQTTWSDAMRVWWPQIVTRPIGSSYHRNLISTPERACRDRIDHPIEGT